MPRQLLRQPYLFVPAKIFLRVLRELDVIGRIRIDEVVSLQWDLFEINAHELPLREGRDVFRKIRLIGDLLVPAKRNIEFAFAD